LTFAGIANSESSRLCGFPAALKIAGYLIRFWTSHQKKKKKKKAFAQDIFNIKKKAFAQDIFNILETKRDTQRKHKNYIFIVTFNPLATKNKDWLNINCTHRQTRALCIHSLSLLH